MTADKGVCSPRRGKTCNPRVRKPACMAASFWPPIHGGYMSRINTNINSLQALHTLSKNQSNLSTSLQRLSTGLRINSAKDDPAGLIASESLRSEIAGINQAIDNSNR